jgi:hypothetical protein
MLDITPLEQAIARLREGLARYRRDELRRRLP